MPKALSPFADEDEKTTIESGWEEEASTTVEQGEVAEKIRTLGLRPITNVTGVAGSQGLNAVEELTMDEPRGQAGMSMMTPPALHARMIITAGNDNGQEIEIIPGKSYTVGRAIDNDIVLTDIAVSRKHFDLRFENGAWVLVDRGSGNGTVINGNIEDAPFMLANGDSIEIGNTTFRYDNPNGMPRNNGFADIPSTNGFNHTGDIVTRNADRFDADMEDEPSTVAGKPLREIPVEPAALNSSRAPSLPPIAPRPKTVPPPAPLPRLKPPSAAPMLPPYGAPMAPPGSMPAMAPHGSMPPMAPPGSMPAMAPPGSMPAMPPLQPSMLGSSSVPAIGSNRPTMLAGGPAPEQMALANIMPSTIPGQGIPMQPSQPQMQALPFTYPNMADHVQHVQSVQHAKMLVITNQQHQQPNGRDATSTAHVPPTPYNGLPVMQPYVAPQLSRRTKLLLGGAGLTVLAAIATIAIIKGAAGGDEPKPTDEPSKVEETEKTKDNKGPTATPIAADKNAAAKDPKAATPKDVKKDPPKEAPKVAVKEPPKDAVKDLPKDPKKDPPKDPKVTANDPPKDPKDVKKDPPKDIVAAVPPKKDPPKDVVAAVPPKKDPPKKDPPKKDPPKKDPPKKKEPPKKEPPKKQVATAGVLDKAKALYREKQFFEAAQLAKTTSDRSVAALYDQLARTYANGTRPTTKPADAWRSLKQAVNYDRALGGFHKDTIQAKQTQVAAKAALSFASQKNFPEALAAQKVAEAAGTADPTVRRLISTHAVELYNAAREEIDSNRPNALAKLRQVKALVDQKNIYYDRAEKLLSANGG